MEKQVLNAIIKTEEKERERFAKDLHDDLGPLLSSVKMYIGMLKKVTNKEKQEFILENLQEIVKEAITTTKEVSNDLNPHVLNNYGLISALKLFVDKLSGNVNIDFQEDIGDSRYSSAIELSLYRISKELINNTIKHAQANSIKLKIWEKGNTLSLLFEDDGKGLTDEAFKIKKPGGMGLSNIISRAKSLNANHTFHTNIKKGFKFEMQVPLIQE
jgi:signal transduction histidine kinase